jgi:hypothetical protein
MKKWYNIYIKDQLSKEVIGMEEHVAFEEQREPVKKPGPWWWRILTSLVVILGIVLTVIFLPSKPTPGGSREPTAGSTQEPSTGESQEPTLEGTQDPTLNNSLETTEDGLYVITTLEDGLWYRPVLYCPWTSSYFGIPVRFDIPEDYWGDTQITYDVHSNSCTFAVPTLDGADYFGDTYNTVGMKIFYAWPYNEELLEQDIGLYIDAVIRADGAPVGYAVIELGYDDGFFFTVRREVVVFPLLDGKFQPVTEEYIQKCIAKAESVRTTDYTYEDAFKERNEYELSLG